MLDHQGRNQLKFSGGRAEWSQLWFYLTIKKVLEVSKRFWKIFPVALPWLRACWPLLVQDNFT